MFIFLSLLIVIDIAVLAEPGNGPSRIQRGARLPTSPLLPRTLLLPRIREAQFIDYMNEIPQSLSRLGFPATQAVPVQTDISSMVVMQCLVRDQMAKAPASGGRFIPLLSVPLDHGLGSPNKVYAMPLIGDSYRRHIMPSYEGKDGKQILVILGVGDVRESYHPPPHVELYGFAQVSGASKLHEQQYTSSAGVGLIHNLESFLDLNNFARGASGYSQVFAATFGPRP